MDETFPFSSALRSIKEDEHQTLMVVRKPSGDPYLIPPYSIECLDACVTYAGAKRGEVPKPNDETVEAARGLVERLKRREVGDE